MPTTVNKGFKRVSAFSPLLASSNIEDRQCSLQNGNGAILYDAPNGESNFLRLRLLCTRPPWEAVNSNARANSYTR